MNIIHEFYKPLTRVARPKTLIANFKRKSYLVDLYVNDVFGNMFFFLNPEQASVLQCRKDFWTDEGQCAVYYRLYGPFCCVHPAPDNLLLCFYLFSLNSGFICFLWIHPLGRDWPTRKHLRFCTKYILLQYNTVNFSRNVLNLRNYLRLQYGLFANFCVRSGQYQCQTIIF